MSKIRVYTRTPKQATDLSRKIRKEFPQCSTEGPPHDARVFVTDAGNAAIVASANALNVLADIDLEAVKGDAS